MQQQQGQDGLSTAPEKLVRNFTTSRFVFWVMVAVAVHVVVIGLTSAVFIRDTWIDPEGARQRKEAAESAAKAEAEKVAKANRPKAPGGGANGLAKGTNVLAKGTNTLARGTNAVEAADETNDMTEADLMEARKTTAIVKAVTATAASNEIPRQPDDLGISINDTNVK